MHNVCRFHKKTLNKSISHVFSIKKIPCDVLTHHKENYILLFLEVNYSTTIFFTTTPFRVLISTKYVPNANDVVGTSTDELLIVSIE